MSEFVTQCPKCKQRITGETNWIGLRTSCPICLHEIILPSPSAAAPAAASGPVAKSSEPAAKGKNTVTFVALAGGALFVVIAATGLIYFVRKPASAAPAPAPSATPPAAQASAVSFHYGDSAIPLGGLAGVVPVPYWNHSQRANESGLLDNSGAPTTVSYSLITKQDWGAWSVSSSKPGQDADGSYNRRILCDYYNSAADSDNPETLSLTGIPYRTYNLYIYFSADVPSREGSISLGDATYYFSTVGLAAIGDKDALLVPTTDMTGANPRADYAVFTGLTGGAQTVTLSVGKGGGISAFQIVTTPPPATRH